MNKRREKKLEGDPRKALKAARNRRYWRRLQEKKRLSKRLSKRQAGRYESGETPIATYGDLVAYLVARRKALGLSQQELDDRAGFQSGYTGKLEVWQHKNGRVAGAVTLSLWFEALGVRLKPIIETPKPPPPGRTPLNGAALARKTLANKEPS